MNALKNLDCVHFLFIDEETKNKTLKIKKMKNENKSKLMTERKRE